MQSSLQVLDPYSTTGNVFSATSSHFTSVLGLTGPKFRFETLHTGQLRYVFLELVEEIV